MRKRISFLVILALVMSTVSLATAQESTRTAISIDNASALQLLQRISRGSAEHAAFTPDGSTILVGGTLGIWQYDATNLSTADEPPLLQFGGEITDFALSPDGSLLAVYHSEAEGVELYTYPALDLVGTYDPEVTPSRLSFSPDSTLVAINGGSRGIEIVSATDGTLVAAFSGSIESEVPIAFSPDSTQIAAAMRSYAVQVWDVAEGAEPSVLEGASDYVNDLAFSAEGSQLLSTSDAVIAWKVVDASETLRVETDGDGNDLRDTYAFAVSPDGSLLYTGETSVIRVWDTASGAQQSVIELETGSIDQITFAPDGSTFLVRISDQSSPVMLFDATSNEMVASVQGHNATINAIDFSPDNNLLAFSDNDGFLYLWDTNEAGEITTATKIEDATTFGIDNLNNIVYSSDNAVLATLDSFGFFLRDPQTGDLLFEISPGGIAFDVAFSPDDSMIAFISSNGLYVYEVATGTELFRYEEANDWMKGVDWSPDQTMLAVASQDHTVRVFTID